jgi:hypothetical protein
MNANGVTVSPGLRELALASIVPPEFSCLLRLMFCVMSNTFETLNATISTTAGRDIRAPFFSSDIVIAHP